MFDAHIVKMPLETAQILYSVWWANNGAPPDKEKVHQNSAPEGNPYKKTHVNHPSCVWARSSPQHYKWLCEYGLALCKEYTYRYNKTHKCQQHIQWLKDCGFPMPTNNELFIHHPPKRITKYATEGCPPGSHWFPLAMPDKFLHKNARRAYSRYYLSKAYGDEEERMKKKATNKRLEQSGHKEEDKKLRMKRKIESYERFAKRIKI